VSYRELADGSWYDDARSCPAAPVFRLGIYLINDLVRLWGRVERVQVMGSRLFTQRPTADNAQVGLVFANGAIANIFASFCVQDGDSYRNTMVLNYERGTIYRNAGPAWEAGPDFRSRLALVQLRGGVRTVVAEGFSPVQSGEYQWETFARAVRGERIGSELSPDQMVEGIRVMRAIAEAEHGSGTARVTR
jgi:predicted dehydrogenase